MGSERLHNKTGRFRNSELFGIFLDDWNVYVTF